LMVLEVSVRRDGAPVHEVLGGIDQPSVIRAGADVVRRFADFDRQLVRRTHSLAGRETLFIGSVASGEIYNQSPVEFRLSGTRRWLPSTSRADVERELRTILAQVASETGTHVDGRFHFSKDPFEIDAAHPLVLAFQAACCATRGEPLPIGAKPFVDDGNVFVNRAGIPAITHGPGGIGAHTLHEEVPIAELARTALVYALTALEFCAAA
jgi:acetylornithine deacetylase